MGVRIRVAAGVWLTGMACVGGLLAQTGKNPISTKPEGAGPTCTYSGTVSDGKPTNSSACQPGATPGTDPHQVAPVSPAQRFPFPGDVPTLSPNPAVPTPTAATGSGEPVAAPATPAAPAGAATPAGQATPSTQAPAAKRFPFPGETPSGSNAPGNEPVMRPAAGDSPALQDAGSSGNAPDPSASSRASSSSSSSSSSNGGLGDAGYSSSGAGADLPDDDPNAPMPTPHRTLRRKLPKEKPVLSPEEQEAEDVQIAAFYQNDGNFLAAYKRAKEAVGLVGDDPEAHIALANAARKLGKLDEAKSGYQKALALDPVPKIRRAAERALKEMSGS